MTTPIRTIRQGDPGSPATVNAPLSQLNQELRRLDQFLADIEANKFIAARRVALGTSTVVGSPVYWNTSTAAFEAAVLSVNNAEGQYGLADSSRVMGVVIAKETPAIGTVMLYGSKAVNITPAIESGTGPGYYYLSTTAGKLTKTRPFIGIPAVFLTNTGDVIMVNRFDDALDRHVHRKFSLTCLPAGDVVPPVVNTPHVINNPNSDLPGWLPADDAIFDGNAPVGAVFGYNLSQDADLKAVWPPDPVESCELIWDTGLFSSVGGTTVPQGYGGLVIIDRNGIWWMSDCYGDVPWPISYNSGDHSTSYSDDPDPECPRHRFMSLMLHTAFPLFDAATSVVTSLRSVDPRITIRCLGTTTEATKGDLEIDLDLTLGISPTASRGATVLKGLEDSTFLQGLVLEGVYAGGDNVILTSDLPPVRLIPGDNTSPLVFQGMVKIEVVPQTTLEVPAQLVRLENVLEQYYSDVAYLGMPAAKESQLRVRFDVPADLTLNDPSFAVRLTLLGRGAGTLPALTLTGRILPKPTAGLATPVTLPGSGAEFAITITTTGTLGSPNQYVDATCTPFEVSPGDIVFIEITRQDDDAYTSEVGIMATTGILSATD
jgi:hypothetical protein